MFENGIFLEIMWNLGFNYPNYISSFCTILSCPLVLPSGGLTANVRLTYNYSKCFARRPFTFPTVSDRVSCDGEMLVRIQVSQPQVQGHQNSLITFRFIHAIHVHDRHLHCDHSLPAKIGIPSIL